MSDGYGDSRYGASAIETREHAHTHTSGYASDFPTHAWVSLRAHQLRRREEEFQGASRARRAGKHTPQVHSLLPFVAHVALRVPLTLSGGECVPECVMFVDV